MKCENSNDLTFLVSFSFNKTNYFTFLSTLCACIIFIYFYMKYSNYMTFKFVKLKVLNKIIF